MEILGTVNFNEKNNFYSIKIPFLGALSCANSVDEIKKKAHDAIYLLYPKLKFQINFIDKFNFVVKSTDIEFVKIVSRETINILKNMHKREEL